MMKSDILQFLLTNLPSVLLTGFLAYIIYIIVTLSYFVIRTRIAFKGFPEPKEGKHWLLGHLLMYLGPDGAQKRLQNILKYVKQFPRFHIQWFEPWRPTIILTHPDTVKVILKGTDPKPVGFGGVYRHLRPWLGDGLLLAGGVRWARSRKLLTPAFHFDILKPYIKVYNQCSFLLAENVEKQVGNQKSFEFFGLASLCTLDIILRCAFSYETNCQSKAEVHPYIKAVGDVTIATGFRSRNPWLFPDFIYYRTKDGRKFSSDCNYVHDVAEQVIRSRREALKREDISKRKYLDFLDILLTAKDQKGKGLRDTEIRAEVDTFLFEGHDTTASSVSWILYSLAEHPEIQRRCQEEIDSVMGDKDEIEWEDLSKFEFLTKCIKEGMRLHSPVPFIARQTQKRALIDGYNFPIGSIILIPICALHNNPTVWENPGEYNPERFAKENLHQINSFAFLPFSAGPRNCIGQTFAMNEEKIILVTLLRRFNFELDLNHEVVKMSAAVMRSKTGIRLFAKHRKNTL